MIKCMWWVCSSLTWTLWQKGHYHSQLSTKKLRPRDEVSCFQFTEIVRGRIKCSNSTCPKLISSFPITNTLLLNCNSYLGECYRQLPVTCVRVWASSQLLTLPYTYISDFVDKILEGLGQHGYAQHPWNENISRPWIWNINHRFQLLLGEWQFVGYNVEPDLGFAI